MKKTARVLKDCDSSSCRTSVDEDDSEGSLANFIEHDSQEEDEGGDGDASYEEEDENAGESDDDEVTQKAKRARVHTDQTEEDAEGEETATEEDADEAIKRQYTTEMETACGSVITSTGVRRSMRSNKGRAPIRYVDEDYVELMLEDVDSEDREALACEITDDEEEEEHTGGEEEEDST